MIIVGTDDGAADQAWREGIERVHAEAAGMVQVSLVQPQGIPALVARAERGDSEAAGLCRGIMSTAARIERVSRRDATLCMCCDTAIRQPEGVTFGSATPAAGSHTTALGFAICRRCTAAAADPMPKVMERLREVWPGLQIITVTHPEGGRA